MYKLIISILLALAIGLLFTGGAFAGDLTVTCPPSEGDGDWCTISPSPAPLFNETNWVPGDFATRTIEVINQDLEDSCNLTLNTIENNGEEVSNTPGFASMLFSDISPYFSDTLQNQFFAGNVSLGTINPGVTQIYSWRMTFDPDAGNEFQSSQTTFNFSLAFSCDLPSQPTPSPTLSPAGPPMNPNEGVSVSPSVLGAFTRVFSPIFGAVSSGEVEEVSIDAASSPSPTQEGEVQGTSDCTDKDYPWWIPLVIQLILGLGYVLYKTRSGKPNLVRLWPLLVLAIISQIIHQILGCNCATSEWCRRYVLLNFVVVAISASPYLFLEKNEKEK